MNTGGLLVLNAVRDTHDLDVDMAVDGPANDVLVAIEDCPVSETPLVEAVSITRRVVSHEHSDFSLGFKLSKGTISILNSEALTVVTVLGIHYLSLVIKVLVPKLEIEGNHWVLLGEVLGVGLDEIVVSFEGVKSVR